MDAKDYLLEIFGYYEYKIRKNLCTPEEIDSAAKLLQENMDIQGTLDDFAAYFGKSKDAVSSVIKRRMIDKPRRNVVLYPFHKFLKIIPDSWRRRH